jgi:hypothetical protein
MFFVVGICLLGAQTFTDLNPTEAKVGQQVTLSGNNLGTDKIKALYVSNDKSDFKAAIVKQADEGITFVVPSAAKSGKYDICLVQVSDPDKMFCAAGLKLEVKP